MYIDHTQYPNIYQAAELQQSRDLESLSISTDMAEWLDVAENMLGFIPSKDRAGCFFDQNPQVIFDNLVPIFEEEMAQLLTDVVTALHPDSRG